MPSNVGSDDSGSVVAAVSIKKKKKKKKRINPKIKNRIQELRIVLILVPAFTD